MRILMYILEGILLLLTGLGVMFSLVINHPAFLVGMAVLLLLDYLVIKKEEAHAKTYAL